MKDKKDFRMILPAEKGLLGETEVPGDKSISHRSVMLGSLAKGDTLIHNFLMGADCLSTIRCFQKMGIPIEIQSGHPGQNHVEVLIHGRGLHGLRGAVDGDSAALLDLDTGNSGTTTRLISGILCGQKFSSRLSGDASLNTRPMKRIIDPLSRMGGSIQSLNGNDCAPLVIRPGHLHGIHYHTSVASAQVKSSILLAGLYADSPVSVTEPSLSRDHTERMLQDFGGTVSSKKNVDGTATASVTPCSELYGREILVPGDISSAAYFIAAALLIPGSELLIKNVGTNPTRAGFLKICREMGADITCISHKDSSNEPSADLLVKYSSLHGVTVEGSIIPTLIDELPMIAVLAAFAKGTTVIRDAAELKVKESNRIDTVSHNLRSMGGEITPTSDGMIIQGGNSLHGAVLDSFLDHRIAMAFTVAALAAEGESRLDHAGCVDISFPGFYEKLISFIR